ncbi:hypothetical protein [Geodermatophilus sp. SYSU D00684]
MRSADDLAELTRQTRAARAELRRRIADSHARVAAAQRATAELMHLAADRLPDPPHVHERADQLAQDADRHLRRAAQDCSPAEAEDGG